MKKVLLFSKYSRMGASSRLRTHQYIPYLNKSDIDVVVSSLFDDDYLNGFYKHGTKSKSKVIKAYVMRLFALFTIFRYDLIWIEKELFPHFPAFFERLLNFMGIRYIVDYDDAIFHNYDLSNNPLKIKFFGKKIDVVMRNSDCVIVGNQYLYLRAKSAGAKKISLIPTVVDDSRYSTKSRLTESKITIGWIGSPSTQKYILDLYDVLKLISQDFDVKVMLIGANKEIEKDLSGLEVDIFDWSEETEHKLISKMDIGIMPLQDGPWEKGKCGYKLIQYMACGVPVVGSPVGVNIDIISESKSGILASSKKEWFDAFSRLIVSPTDRLSFGVSGRNAVESYYSVNIQKNKIKDIILSSISS